MESLNDGPPPATEAAPATDAPQGFGLKACLIAATAPLLLCGVMIVKAALGDMTLLLRVSGWAALVLGVVQLAGCAIRVLVKHWSLTVIRPLLALEAILALLLASAGGYAALSNGAGRLLVLAGVLSAATPLYWASEDGIAKALKKDGKAAVTQHVRRFQPLCKLRSYVSIGELVDNYADWPALKHPARLLARRVSTRGSVRMSPSRALYLTVMAFVFVALMSGAVAGFVGQEVRDRKLEKEADEKDSTKPRETVRELRPTNPPAPSPAKKPPPAQSADPATSGVGSPINEDRWTDVCGKQLPGAGGPRWARSGLYNTYLGTGGPGAAAGCTGEVHRVSDRFVFTEGRAVAGSGNWPIGTLLSIATNSRYWGPALFLAPATRVVKRLITSKIAFGGSQRANMEDGDFQMIYTREGTRAVARRTKVTTTKNARPYVDLSPRAVTQWQDAMRLRRRWLWPAITSDRLDRQMLVLKDRLGREILRTPIADSVEMSGTTSSPLRPTVTLRNQITPDDLLGAARLGADRSRP